MCNASAVTANLVVVLLQQVVCSVHSGIAQSNSLVTKHAHCVEGRYELSETVHYLRACG